MVNALRLITAPVVVVPAAGSPIDERDLFVGALLVVALFTLSAVAIIVCSFVSKRPAVIWTAAGFGFCLLGTAWALAAFVSPGPHQIKTHPQHYPDEGGLGAYLIGFLLLAIVVYGAAALLLLASLTAFIVGLVRLACRCSPAANPAVRTEASGDQVSCERLRPP